MKKLLSICLSIMLIVSTLSVLMAIPTSAVAENIIVNGDGNALDGWSVTNGDGNLRVMTPADFTIIENPAEYYKNYSKDTVLGVNQGQFLSQNVELKEGKEYFLSVKLASNASNQASTGKFNVFFSTPEKYTAWWTDRVHTKPWFAQKQVTASADGVKWSTTENCQYYAAGDFTEHSFTFKADELAAFNGISAVGGKYNVTLYIQSELYGWFWMLVDDVVLREVSNDLSISATAGGTVDKTTATLGESVTVTATPYYGNTFAGWYDDADALVSSDATYTGVVTGNLTAKFNAYNMFDNGNFEDGTLDAFALNIDGVGEMGITSLPASDNAGHGANALSVTSDGGVRNIMQYLLKTPSVTVKKNTEYVLRYSYYNVDKTGQHYLSAHSEKSFTNVYTFTAEFAKYGFAWQTENADSTTANLGGWTYKGAKNSTFWSTTHTNVGTGIGKWVDVVFVFDTGDSNTIFADGSDTGVIWFNIGSTYDDIAAGTDNSPNFYIDNISLTEAGSSVQDAVTVTAGSNGTVKSSVKNNKLGAYYYATDGVVKGEAPATWYMLDGSGVAYAPRYSKAAASGEYTATANEGFAFAGWYDGNGQLVSDSATTFFATEGNYTARFEATIGSTDGGYVVDNGDGTKTAHPYYGNTFDGWYDGTTLLSENATVNTAAYATAVARYYKHNQLKDGDFSEGTGNAMLIGSGSTSNILTDTDGNRYLRLTSVTSGANFTAFSWPFTVEKGKKYVVSYKIREGRDALGQTLSSVDMSFRKQIRPMNAAGTDYDWIGLKFADQRLYTYGNIQNYFEANTDLLPPGGTYLNPSTVTEGIDYFGRYSDNWVTYSYILDASTLNNVGGTNDFFANGNTAKVGIVLGPNEGGTMIIDVDDIVVSEVKEEYEVPANPVGGTVTIDRRASTAALPVTYTAYPDSDGNYSFVGWYNAENKIVSADASYTPASAVTLTPKFEMDKLGFTKVDGDNVTAYAYYGNKFDGWYQDGILKSTEKTVSAATAAGWTAKFKKGGNLLHDGGFEEGAATEAIYDAYTDYANGSTKQVVPTYVPGSGPQFGDYCLQLTPIQELNNGKLKSLLNVPVELEAGKTYLWKFSYAYTTGAYDPTRDYINFSVDEADAAGKVPWYNGNVEYCFHSQPASSEVLVENGYAWGLVAIEADGGVAAYTNNNNFSASGEWVDMYVLFTPKNTAKHYLSLGTTTDQKNTIVVDNMSLSVVETGRTPTSVVAGENGSVVSYRADEPAYMSVNRRSENNSKPVSESGKVDFQNPYYADIYASYFAVPALGYTFDGWYQGNLKVSSDKELVVKATGEGEYVAKFTQDANRYYATAEVEKQNGVYGGYITGENTYNEILSGETVTFTAVSYKGNSFDGWYDKTSGKRLSTNAVFNYSVTSNTELVAKFNVNNIFTDSGLENTNGAVSDWDKTTSISAAFSYDGKQSLNFYAPSETIRHTAFTVDDSATYHFSFMWKGSSSTAKLDYIKVYNGADNTVLAEANNFSASAEQTWQKAFVNFAANGATSVIVEIKYSGTGASLYIDDATLFNTANAKFEINVSLQKEGDIFPGFIASDATQYASYGENVTVSAVGYEKNIFNGWYENGKKVSSDLDFTFPADSFTNLTAMFTVKNIFPDSGAENTEKDVSLSHGKYTDWFVDENNYRDWNFDVVATDSNKAHTGNAIFNATHRTTNYGTTIKGLKEKTNYVFSFWWNFSQPGNFAHALLKGVQTDLELARGMGGNSDGNWQQVIVPFYSGQNTEIEITFLYNAGSGACMMDDFALYESNFIGIYAAEGGSVTSDLNGGANGPAEDGEVVTATAIPDAGNTFKGWYNYNNLQEVVSTNATYTFTVNGPKHIIAYFEGDTAEDVNYFVDGDFENNCFQGVIFSHPFWESDWCSYSIVKHGKSDTLLPISGDKMLKVSAHSRNSNIFLNNLKPQTDYTLSFYWNADPGAGVDRMMLFRFFDESDDKLDQKTYKHVTSYQLNFGTADVVHESMHETSQIFERGDGEWTRVEMSFNSGNRTQAVLLFNMSLELGGDPALYFDDFCLTEGNTQTETIANGDFSDATNLKGWQGEFSTATEGSNTYGKFNGEIHNSVKFDSVNAYPYIVTFKAKSAVGATLRYGMSPAGALSLYENGKHTAMSNTSLGAVTLTSAWKEYSFPVAYNGFESAKLFFAAQGGEICIDDVSMKMSDRRIDVEKFTFEDDTDNTIAGTTGIDYAVNEYNQQFFAISNTVSKSGNNSLMMSAKNLMPGANKTEDTYYKHALAQNWSWLYLMSGRRYTISFWAKADNIGDEVIVQTTATNDNWGKEVLASKTVKATDTKWNQYSFDFTVINLNATPNIVNFIIRDSDKQNSGNVYIDDVVISEALTSVTSAADRLYTEDISQNYFRNPSFEKADSAIAAYVKTGDAFYGDKYVSVKAGDKLIIPATTKPDYDITKWLGNYTFAASVRGNSSAQGYVGVSYTPDGASLMTDKYGNAATISVNTDGKWARSGYNFSDYRWTNLYLVIECTAGSFDVDYISMFNQMRSYKENPQLEDTTVEFTDYHDMGSLNKGTFIGGNLLGLPEESKVVLVGDKTYSSDVAEDGRYDITNIADGEYQMFIYQGDTEFMTLWGDLKVTDDGLSGLACERLSGDVYTITATGVRNGIVKITDGNTGWSYLTATGSDGNFTAYVLGDNCYIAGTTKIAEVLEQYGINSEDFVINLETKNATPAVTTVTGEASPVNSDGSTPLLAVVTIMISAAALIVLTRKKGECK